MTESRQWVEVTHPCLKQKAQEVPLDEIASDEIQQLIDEMLRILGGERGAKQRKGVGIAAPQIGVMKRVILVDVGVDEKRKELGTLEAFINPEIIHQSDEFILEREGCFSVYSSIIGVVPRSSEITVKAYDREGNPIEQVFRGYTARIFQHEIDHLNGIRFPQRIGNEGKLHWVTEEEFPTYRETWKEWNKNCPPQIWEHIQQGQPFSEPK